MRALVLAAALVVAACSSSDGGKADTVTFHHDAIHKVSCWTIGSGESYAVSISCLPDKEVFVGSYEIAP